MSSGRFARASAFAPATVGNVAVGFDVLGHSLATLGDTVTVRRQAGEGVTIKAIRGLAEGLPLDPEQNTAGRALQSLLSDVQPGFAVEVEIDKGIPLASGLGGSAASAVAAVVACNALLENALEPLDLLRHALEGEAVASGSRHVDNVAPALMGGLVLALGGAQPRMCRIPVPAQIRAVVVHPHMQLSTRAAREILRRDVPLVTAIQQSANLAGLISGCFSNDLAMIGASLQDVMIEPQRAALIPGFHAVKAAALEKGALGCSISGAGPTLFAWCLTEQASAVAQAMAGAFQDHALQSDQWICAIEPQGARVLSAS